MKRILKAIALAIALGATATWLSTGAHRGWTKTSIERKSVDEVTGIEAITYEKGFVAGVDFLGAALLGAAVLAGVSIFVKPKQKVL
jgi:hypothetical protein